MLDPSEVESVREQIARGNPDAFQRILRAFGLPLRSYIAAQVYHQSDVDDLTQEVFIAAYRSLNGFRKNNDLGAWLRGIARRKLYVYSRSAARRDKALARFREEVTRAIQSDLERSATGDRTVAIEMLLRCIARLPEKMRRVVRAGLEGEKPASLAEEFVTSVGAVYNLHYRANQLLRDCVEKELG
jgi:RNA polymerase sigma-70 factor (ECF subfamily)